MTVEDYPAASESAHLHQMNDNFAAMTTPKAHGSAPGAQTMSLPPIHNEITATGASPGTQTVDQLPAFTFLSDPWAAPLLPQIWSKIDEKRLPRNMDSPDKFNTPSEVPATFASAMAELKRTKWRGRPADFDVMVNGIPHVLRVGKVAPHFVTDIANILYANAIDFSHFYDKIKPSIDKDGNISYGLAALDNITAEELKIACFNIAASDMVCEDGTKINARADPTSRPKAKHERKWTIQQRVALIARALRLCKKFLIDILNNEQNLEMTIVLAPQCALDTKLRQMPLNDDKAVKLKKAKDLEAVEDDSTGTSTDGMAQEQMPKPQIPSNDFSALFQSTDESTANQHTDHTGVSDLMDFNYNHTPTASSFTDYGGEDQIAPQFYWHD